MKRKRIKTFAIAALVLGISFISSVVPVKAAHTDVPSDASSFGTHYYKIYHDQLSWSEAKKECELLGGHLVTITNAQEQDFIERLNEDVDSLWMGAYRDEDFNWYWVTGEDWKYVNWGEGEPNNQGDERYGAVWPKEWNDLCDDSWEQSGYICEWDDGSTFEPTFPAIPSVSPMPSTPKDPSMKSSTGYYKAKEFAVAETLYGKSFLLSKYDSERSIFIPGLEKTVTQKKDCKKDNRTDYEYCHNMVPQGVCFLGKKDEYMLISAYCADAGKDKHKSVIYVLSNPDKVSTENQKLYTTLILPDSTHAGGIACGNNLVWIASTNNVKVISTSDIKKAIDAKRNFCNVEYNKYKYSVDDEMKSNKPTDTFKLDVGASFVTYSNGMVHVGEFVDLPANVKLKGWDIDVELKDAPYLCGYKVKQDNDTLRFNIQYSTKIPYETQGVEFCQYAGKQHILFSCSWGPVVNSVLDVQAFNFQTGKRSIFSLSSGTWEFPCMSEDICIRNGRLYSCYESASNNYKNALSKVDRIVSLDAQAIGKNLFGKSTYAEIGADKESDAEQEEIYEENLIASGECGENLRYLLYDNGELILEGYGDMYDYEESPFLEYNNQIQSVSIPFAVTRVGVNAFNGLNNLEVAYILGDFDQTVIGQSAFENCTKLREVYFGDREVEEYNAFIIQDNAFKNCSDLEECAFSSSCIEAEDNCFDEIDKPVQISVNSWVDLSNLTDNNSNISVHEHEYGFDCEMEPTCNSAGAIRYVCECGAYLYEATWEATNDHQFVDGVCIVCGMPEYSSEEHEPGEFEYNEDGTCYEDGTMTVYCINCGNELGTAIAPDTTSHVWDDGIITKWPTFDKTGVMTYSCLNCSARYTETIDALGTESPSVTPSEIPGENPSIAPSEAPSAKPSVTPGTESGTPSVMPSGTPGDVLASVPSVRPSKEPAKQTIKVSKKASKTVTYKVKDLKKKKVTFKIGAKAKTKLTYTVSKKAKRYISVSKTGKVTIKKGCKKGTYKITIVATKTKDYQKATKTVTIKVK